MWIRAPLPLGRRQPVLLLAVGTAGALGVVLVAMPLADRLTKPEVARFE